MKDFTAKDIQERTLEIIKEKLFQKSINPNNTLKQLKADSLDLAELEIALEEEFQIEISDEEHSGVSTVQDIINLVMKKIHEKPVVVVEEQVEEKRETILPET